MQVFEDAQCWPATSGWPARSTPASRELEHTPEYPTFSQSMGQMFLGGFADRARRLMMGGDRSNDRGGNDRDSRNRR